MARLEWAWHRASIGPDPERLDMEALARTVGGDPDRVVFLLPANARLVESPFPIDRIWETNQPDHQGDDVVDLSKGGARLLVCRDGPARRMEPLADAEWRLLHAMSEGLGLGQICLRLAREHPASDEGWLLAVAISRGWISGFHASQARARGGRAASGHPRTARPPSSPRCGFR